MSFLIGCRVCLCRGGGWRVGSGVLVVGGVSTPFWHILTSFSKTLSSWSIISDWKMGVISLLAQVPFKLSPHQGTGSLNLCGRSRLLTMQPGTLSYSIIIKSHHELASFFFFFFLSWLDENKTRRGGDGGGRRGRVNCLMETLSLNI